MSTELKRYTRPIDRQELGKVMAEQAPVETEPAGVGTAEFAPVREVLYELLKRPHESNRQRAAWDRELVEPLHRAMPGLTRRVAADMRFWHWLCIDELNDLVWYRWHGSVPDVPPDVLEGREGLAGRFVGTSSLGGISRNALARLWWCAESLRSEFDGYEAARDALLNQDLFQAIFERRLGLYPPLARAILDRFKGATQAEFRLPVKRLNNYATTFVLETLSEDDLGNMLDELRREGGNDT